MTGYLSRDVTVGAGVGVTLASIYMRIFPTIKEFIKTLPPTHAALGLQLVPAAFYCMLRVAFSRYKSRATSAEMKQWSEVASSGRKELEQVCCRACGEG